MTIDLRDLRVLRARISCLPFYSCQFAVRLFLFDLCWLNTYEPDWEKHLKLFERDLVLINGINRTLNFFEP
jgi:hypothetical protein